MADITLGVMNPRFQLPKTAFRTGKVKRRSITRSVMPTMVDITLRVMKGLHARGDGLLFPGLEAAFHHAERDVYYGDITQA